MSQGGGGGGGGHHQYRTQSDTLKLQRLIEVLKQRGSDLAGSLESSAADFLTDVKTPAARAAAEKLRQEDDDDGSSFEGSDYEQEVNVRTTEVDSLKSPLLPTPPSVSKQENITHTQSEEVTTEMPRESGRDMTASMVAAAVATAAAPAVADVLQIPHEAMIRRRVHFEGIPDQSDSQSPTPTASEASASPLPSSSPLPAHASQPSSESGGTIITELVRKSSEVLNLLTMSMVDADSNKEKQQVAEQVVQQYVENQSSANVATFEIDSSSSSPSSSEYEDDFEVGDDCEEEDVVDSSCNVPYARFDKNDPPDPKELAKLHNRRWKKKPTMALKWRRQRERTRLLMQQDQ